MNNNVLSNLHKSDIETISMPSQIKAMLNSYPQINMKLMDYDYVGNAKEQDFESFAKLFYANCNSYGHYIMVINSIAMSDSKLLRKTFKFNLTQYTFSKEIETFCVPISDALIVFLGIIDLKTFDDFRCATRFLFSGIYDSQYFVIQYSNHFTKSNIITLLKDSLRPIMNRYNQIQNVVLSINFIHQHSCSSLKILYPYGGTDFGSFMFFML